MEVVVVIVVVVVNMTPFAFVFVDVSNTVWAVIGHRASDSADLTELTEKHNANKRSELPTVDYYG